MTPVIITEMHFVEFYFMEKKEEKKHPELTWSEQSMAANVLEIRK